MSLLGVGTVPRLGRDAWSMVICPSSLCPALHPRPGCYLRAGVSGPRRRIVEAAAGQRRAERVRDGDHDILLPHLLHLTR